MTAIKDAIRRYPWILAIVTVTACLVVLLLAWRGEVTFDAIVSHLAASGAGAALLGGARRKGPENAV